MFDRLLRQALCATALLLVTTVGCGGGRSPEEQAMMDLGRKVFTDVAEPSCTTCHALQDADATAQIGPDLDAMAPDSQRVAAAVRNGLGAMPAQKNVLTKKQIQAVAYYVAEVTKSGP